jgi:hypothetical protein
LSRSVRGVTGVWGAAEGQAEGQGQGQGWQQRRRWRALQQGGGGGEQQRRGEHVAWGRQPPQHAAISKRWPPQHGGGCSAGRAPLRGGDAADGAPACWRRQEGEGAAAEGAAEAAQNGRGVGGAAGSDRGDVGRKVREPSVVDVHRQVSWGGDGVYVRVAGRTHVWRCVWLQRGELAAGCGGGGDGGGGEARGLQREAVSAGGGGEGND